MLDFVYANMSKLLIKINVDRLNGIVNLGNKNIESSLLSIQKTESFVNLASKQ